MSATPHSITEPLNLRGHLRTAPRAGWDFIAVLDLLLIALLLFANHSRFVFAPGAEVSLSSVSRQPLTTVAGSAVLTVRANGMLFFDGRKMQEERLESVLAQFTLDHPGETELLLKLDRSISVQELMGLFEIAQAAGFDRVQLAAEHAIVDSSSPDSVR